MKKKFVVLFLGIILTFVGCGEKEKSLEDGVEVISQDYEMSDDESTEECLSDEDFEVESFGEKREMSYNESEMYESESDKHVQMENAVNQETNYLADDGNEVWKEAYIEFLAREREKYSSETMIELIDYDENDIPEMVVTPDTSSMQYNIYTYYQDKVINLAEVSSAYFSYYIDAPGKYLVHGADSSWATFESIYTIENGKLDEICAYNLENSMDEKSNSDYVYSIDGEQCNETTFLEKLNEIFGEDTCSLENGYLSFEGYENVNSKFDILENAETLIMNW